MLPCFFFGGEGQKLFPCSTFGGPTLTWTVSAGPDGSPGGPGPFVQPFFRCFYLDAMLLF